MDEFVKKYLGMKVKDKVLGVTGVVTSVCFDLYGCVQADVHPGVDKVGKALESRGWFDVSRLEITSSKRVMALPDFVRVPGPSDKLRAPSR
jgi:hypothetical protein